MKSLINGILILTILSVSSAMATRSNPDPDPSQEQEQEQGQAQGQAQGQLQGQGQAQGQIANAEGGDSESTAIAGAAAISVVDASSQVDVATGDVITGDTTVTVQGDETFYDFPSNSAYAPNGLSHIRCDQLLGIGYTNVNGSGSIGAPIPRWMSAKIRDCESNADSNWLSEFGLAGAAIEARCATRSMRERFGNGEKGKKNQTTACVTALGTIANANAAAQKKRDAELANLRSELDELRRQIGRVDEACDEKADRQFEACAQK